MNTPTKIPDDLKKEIDEKTKDMTETERLKFNTKLYQALDQAEEIHKYLKVRQMMRNGVNKRSWQLLGISILCLVASIVFDIRGNDTVSLVFNGLWLIFFLCHLFAEMLKARAEGQLQGAINMLEILGHIDEDDCDCDNCKPKKKKKVKSKSWFARPKEFFERMGQSKQAYGVQ